MNTLKIKSQIHLHSQRKLKKEAVSPCDYLKVRDFFNRYRQFSLRVTSQNPDIVHCFIILRNKKDKIEPIPVSISMTEATPAQLKALTDILQEHSPSEVLKEFKQTFSLN